MSTEKFTCPRRVRDGMADPASMFRGAGADQDTYEPRHGLVGQPRGCSYCGSMPQEDFMAAVRAGAKVEPTDKSYKIYLSGIKREGDPKELRVISSSSSPVFGGKSYNDLNPEEKAAVKAHCTFMTKKEMKAGYYKFAEWGETVEGKFYTPHFTDQALVDEFYELMQAGKIKFGYPGHFYRALGMPVMPTQLKGKEK